MPWVIRQSVLARTRSIGSGVIVDPAGYILTNAHVIDGAERIEVVLAGDGESNHPPTRVVRATLMGRADEIDLALLSIPVQGLHALRIPDSTQLVQGEIVFAFGSPDGLRNSVSMGMVSAVSRQLDEDSPIPYVQTDAAINPETAVDHWSASQAISWASTRSSGPNRRQRRTRLRAARRAGCLGVPAAQGLGASAPRHHRAVRPERNA